MDNQLIAGLIVMMIVAFVLNILITGAIGALVGLLVGLFFPTIFGFAAWKFFAATFIVLGFIRSMFAR